MNCIKSILSIKIAFSFIMITSPGSPPYFATVISEISLFNLLKVKSRISRHSPNPSDKIVKAVTVLSCLCHQ